MEPNLDELVWDLDEWEPDAAYRWGESRYCRCFIDEAEGSPADGGVWRLHDGESVVFFRDRFEHAFRTSSNRMRHPDIKDVVAVDRIELIDWILPILRGQVPEVECWRIPRKGTKPYPSNRLYVLWGSAYVIWLEPLRRGGYKFSSAYKASLEDIRRYVKQGNRCPERNVP